MEFCSRGKYLDMSPLVEGGAYCVGYTTGRTACHIAYVRFFHTCSKCGSFLIKFCDCPLSQCHKIVEYYVTDACV